MSIQIKLENEGSDEELETDMLYSPQLALKLALTEWLGEFCVPRQYNSKPIIFYHTLLYKFLLKKLYLSITNIDVFIIIMQFNNIILKLNLFISGNQVSQGGIKGTAIDVSSMPPPSLCSSTTVTTVFQQPIMSPAIPSLSLDQLPHPMAKVPQEEEEVS